MCPYTILHINGVVIVSMHIVMVSDRITQDKCVEKKNNFGKIGARRRRTQPNDEMLEDHASLIQLVSIVHALLRIATDRPCLSLVVGHAR